MIGPNGNLQAPDYKVTDFETGEEIFVNLIANGWWAKAIVVRRGKKQVCVKFIVPEWDNERWSYPSLMVKTADVPPEWHKDWLSQSGRILAALQEREQRNYWARRRRYGLLWDHD